jgi:hypothetical protein
VSTAPRTSSRRPRHPRGRRVAAWALQIGLAVALFGLGVAFGQALRENPEPGQDRTFVRTLRPLPVSPEPATVTVTVTVEDS